MARSISLLIAALLMHATAAAALEGVYEELPLKKKHDHELIKDSAELTDYFERRQLVHTDGELERYLSAVAKTIVTDPTDPYMDYRFYVFRDPSPNAFALPDGQIYVNTGMLARLEDEAQLAALLAHEINHVAGHHSIISVRVNQRQGVASTVLSGVLAGVGGGWASLADLGQNMAFTMASLGYSRDLEEEADRRGFNRLRDANYDVRAMAEIFEILNKDLEGERPPQSTKWSTHPDLADRAAYLSDLAASVDKTVLENSKRNVDVYRNQTRAVALMTVRDYSRADYPRTAIALARDLIEHNPDQPDIYTALGEAYHVLGAREEYEDVAELSNRDKRANRKARRKTREQRRAERLETPEGQANFATNLAAAEAAYNRAIELNDSYAPAYRGLGELYQDMQRTRPAAKAYLSYVKLAPQATDQRLIKGRLQQLVAQIRSPETTEDTDSD